MRLCSHCVVPGLCQDLHMDMTDTCRYIYSGQVALNTESVLGLLVLADKYNVPDLKDCCSLYMSRHLVSDDD